MINNTKPAAHALASFRPGTKENWFGKNGHLNAGSNAEVMVQTARMMSAIASGELTLSAPEEAQQQVMTASERRQLIVDAYYDRSTAAWAETGSSIGATLYETAVRQGFMRRFLVKGDLAQGSIPRVAVRTQNVTAIAAASPSQYAPIFAKQKYIYPPEFYVSGNVRVEERDIVQGNSDLLEDVYARAQEQINTVEDRVYVKLLDNTVGVANPLFLLSGGMTPANLAASRTAMIQWGLSAENLILSADFWTDIAGNASAFGNLFDPVTQYELIQTGYLGTLLGMGITTDGFRDPNQKVVLPNDGYILSSPINHGAYTDRGPVNATPVDSYQDGVPARGWFFNELLAMVVANPRSVVKIRRS